MGTILKKTAISSLLGVVGSLMNRHLQLALWVDNPPVLQNQPETKAGVWNKRKSYMKLNILVNSLHSHNG